MELKDRLKKARKAKNLSQSSVAESIEGLSQSAYSQLESGRSKATNKMAELANLFGVSAYWLATGQGEMTAKPTIDELRQRIKAIENRQSEVEPSDFLSVNNPVPIISWVAAGSWSSSDVVEWVDEDTEYLPRPANLSAKGFCLRVRGVSMMPEFKPDEVIFVEPNFGVWDLKNGDLVVVRENGNHEATFKQLIMGETSADMYLKPLNPDWHEQRMTPKSEWELVGKVVGKWVKY
ncbi:helix-turn-helix domain-containing protein [Moraxella bovis]|uniref:helix-turn-helix domain-containing protein n=1 Tax=Moraxella bovis TaxID=476 RepID=UPI002225B71F|nr:XRE family transcriptional regulator [Moraxella bovis]UYZ79862.1 XRE family transcriptional regulator [Moraxella bovis]